MVNPDPERTTINVKGVPAPAWETARRAAAKRGDTMGTWLGRAIEMQANLEAGPREMPPEKPEANRGFTGQQMEVPYVGAVTPEGFGAMMQGWASFSQATGKPPPRAVVSRANRLGDAIVRAALGLPGQPKRLAAGKTLTIERKPGTISPDGDP